MSALTVRSRQKNYEMYMAECMRAVVFNTANQGQYMTMKPYKEIIAPKPAEDDDKKAKAIIKKMKKILKGG